MLLLLVGIIVLMWLLKGNTILPIIASYYTVLVLLIVEGIIVPYSCLHPQPLVSCEYLSHW